MENSRKNFPLGYQDRLHLGLVANMGVNELVDWKERLRGICMEVMFF